MLLVHADPHGRGDLDLGGIKMRVVPGLPETEKDIEKALISLNNCGLIVIYKVADKQYYQISQWDRFQNFTVNNRGFSSKFPDPPKITNKIVNHCESLKITCKEGEVEGEVEKEVEVELEEDFLSEVETARLGLVKLLCELMLQNNPKAKITDSQIDQWMKAVRLMQEQDSRTLEEIRAVIEFSQRDDFWRTNVLSMATVRKQFDKLTMKMRKPTSKTESIFEQNLKNLEIFKGRHEQ